MFEWGGVRRVGLCVRVIWCLHFKLFEWGERSSPRWGYWLVPDWGKSTCCQVPGGGSSREAQCSLHCSWLNFCFTAGFGKLV